MLPAVQLGGADLAGAVAPGAERVGAQGEPAGEGAGAAGAGVLYVDLDAWGEHPQGLITSGQREGSAIVSGHPSILLAQAAMCHAVPQSGFVVWRVVMSGRTVVTSAVVAVLVYLAMRKYEQSRG